MPKGFGISPDTNTIYYGTLDPAKLVWTGKKEDVTEDAIRTVFAWFIGNMEGNDEYAINFPNTEYELVMRRREIKEETKAGNE